MNFIFAALIAVILFLPPNASALEVSNQIKEYANKHLLLTKKFGEFKVGDIIRQNNVPLLIEYIPVRSTIDNWTTLSTLTVFSCTQDKAICNNLSKKLSVAFLDKKTTVPGFEKIILDSQVWNGDKKDHLSGTKSTTYFNYKIGSSPIQENIAGVIYTSGSTVNIFQLQKRGSDKLTEKNKRDMRAMANFFSKQQ